MRRGGGGAKGGAFERLIAKGLSGAITQGANLEALWRTASSGGRATVRRKKKLGRDSMTELAHIAGDLCAVHKDGEKFIAAWLVECKHYRNLDVESFLFRSAGKLHKFWAKARTEARRANKRPMLVFKQNNLSCMILLRQEDLVLFDLGWQEAVVMRMTDKTYLFDFDYFCKHAQFDSYC